jgi:AcrR family transcriptional regulator
MLTPDHGRIVPESRSGDGSSASAAAGYCMASGHEGNSGSVPRVGLRERKKARLRQQIIDTAIRLFRERGYESTRIDDIAEALEISQPTFFRYFPTKSAVLVDFALEGIARVTEELGAAFAADTTTADRLREFFGRRATRIEADEPLWRAVVLSGAMDPVVSPPVRESDAKMVEMLQEILLRGQERGEVTPDIPVVHLTQAIDGLYKVMIWKWAGNIGGPHSFAAWVASAVEVFLRGIAPHAQ